MVATFLLALLSAVLVQPAQAADPLVREAGHSAPVPSWDIQAAVKAGTDLSKLSTTGIDTSAWNHVKSSHCTLMGCFLEAGVYADDKLFYSDTMKTFDDRTFHGNWLYRNEFGLSPGQGRHFFLETHGITSRADIFLNGKQVVKSSDQAGAYAGRSYEITSLVGESNALLVQTYPTDYNYDFALGFVDWNPYPPDNGTGVWREIEVKQTGPVALGPLRVVTDVKDFDGTSPATVQFKASIKNLEDREVTADVGGEIILGSNGVPLKLSKSVKLNALQTTEVVISQEVSKPAIWWPKAWGAQPLYTGTLTAKVGEAISDSVQRSFGIRTVTSKVNIHNDTIFSVNGHPFQVIGGGYSADMFLRWDTVKFEAQAKLMLDLGHNTVRLEGKNEHPELYNIADRIGLMVMAGWECCDKWEAWTYNEDLAVHIDWTDADYEIAKNSMVHEAHMQQTHPSMLAYLVGSDYWPDDRATKIYVDAMKAADWQVPIIASASKRGYPELLGPSGMKMAGPYDWVPPNYWYDTEPANEDERFGSSFGFGSELGAGVGTPELSSLKRFMSESDLDDLWKNATKGQYHMSTEVSSFYTREIYNEALWKRFGAPTSLDDYLLKAQIMDYEATRAQFEGFAVKWNSERPATGLIYWMLNNAWPSLHWNLFDYYLHPAGSYFGAKTGARHEHVAYNLQDMTVHIINHSIDIAAARTVDVEIVGLDGTVIFKTTKADINTEPNVSKQVLDISKAIKEAKGVIFLRLLLKDPSKNGAVISRNVYWLSSGGKIDTMNWENSTWYSTPVTEFVDFKSLLTQLQPADVVVTIPSYPSGSGSDVASAGARSIPLFAHLTPKRDGNSNAGKPKSCSFSNGGAYAEDTYGPISTVVLENKSDVPAFFIRLNLVDSEGEDVNPVFWSDNYVTLWPRERLELQVQGAGGKTVQVSGGNVKAADVKLVVS